MTKEFLDGRLIVKVGDITLEDVDAIVNAANWTLLGGGGVDGAIHKAGGPSILDECRSIREEYYRNGLPTGEAVITTGGNMPAKHVIHTVGPIYGQNQGRDAELLAECYENSIAIAADNGLSSIAFPAISTGAFGYPKHEAAKVAAAAITASAARHPSVSDIRLVFFSATDAAMFIKHSDLDVFDRSK